MKIYLSVFIFIGGIILGVYFINPAVNNVNAGNYNLDEEYYYEGHCGYNYDILDRFLSLDLTDEQIDLITVKYNELLLEYEITEDELYSDMDTTHDIMIEMMEYLESLDIEYNNTYRRSHMFR